MSPSSALLILCCIFLVISPSLSQVDLGPMKILFRTEGTGKVTLLTKSKVRIDTLTLGAGDSLRFMIGNDTDKYKAERTTLQGLIIPNEKGSCDRLREYSGETIELTLPAKRKFTDFHYLAIFCIKYNHNFAYVTIPKGTVAPTATTGNLSAECDQKPKDRNNSAPSSFSSGQVVLWICVFVPLGFSY